MFSAIDALEFPELHDESIPAVAFQRHLGRLLAAAGVRDFSLKARAGTALLVIVAVAYRADGPRWLRPPRCRCTTIHVQLLVRGDIDNAPCQHQPPPG